MASVHFKSRDLVVHEFESSIRIRPVLVLTLKATICFVTIDFSYPNVFMLSADAPA